MLKGFILSNSLTLLVQICLLLASLFSVADENSEDKEHASAAPSWSQQLYLETYSSPFSDTLVHFQKYDFTKNHFEQFHFTDNWKFLPYFSLRNYQDVSSQNTEFEIGLRAEYSKLLSVFIAADREKLNLKSGSYNSGKIGLVASDFIPYSLEKLYSEYYLEIYYFIPEISSSYASSSGWCRMGYRYYHDDNHIFDALTLQLRAFDTNNKILGGSDYHQFTIGPRYLLVTSNPNFVLSFQFAKSWNKSSTSPMTDQTWFLLTFGARL